MLGGHPCLRQGFGRQARTMKMVPVIRIRKPGSQEFKLTLTLYFLANLTINILIQSIRDGSTSIILMKKLEENYETKD
jgi:hypothetical protein